MTSFGNFVQLDQRTPESQSGTMPADIGLGGKGNSILVDAAWAISPANYLKQSATGELRPSAYGSGAGARLYDSVLTGLELSQPAYAPLPQESPAAARVPASIEGKTLRSILPAVSFSGRAAETPSSRPPDLIDALAQPAAKAATFAEIMPARPFTGVVQGPRVEVAIATQAATAKSDTGPLPVVARVETSPVRTAESDIKSNPLFALINQNAKPRGFDNFNARMEKSPTSVESLSRQIMTADFRPQQSWQDGGQARPKALDPFLAANCYQSMEFGPDGTVKTTTTLPDLSASKIESLYPDKSTSVALTDYLGRITIEQRVDATGQLTSQTTNRFDHTESPLVASLKTVQTATQSIETRQDPTGKVIASKVMPYSDLNAAKSIA